MRDALIIVGASARAAAGSALRAGYAPWCVDLFADRDLRAMAPVKRCPPERYPHGLVDLLDDAPDAPVLLTGALENHPDVVEAIAARRPLLGPSPAAIRAARDPRLLADMPGIPGVQNCPTWLAGHRLDPGMVAPHRLLLKPVASGSGRGIRPWYAVDGLTVPDDYFLQRFVDGVALGAVFAAGAEGVALLGVTEQLIGDERLGSHCFQYCGSVGPFVLTARQMVALGELGRIIAQRCGLRGVYGIDLILDADGELWPIEINPRYTASAEIIEAATGGSVLGPVPSHGTPRHSLGVQGKAIVFAQHNCSVPDLYHWFSPGQVADVPEAGEPVAAHRPICTLFASGPDWATCLQRLHDMGDELYTRLQG